MSSAGEPSDPQPGIDLRKAAALLGLLVAYQLALHFAVSSDPGSGFGEVLTIAPIAAATIWLGGHTWRRRIRVAVPVVIVVAGWIAMRSAGADPALVYVLPHAGTYLVLLWLFGRTLAPGTQPLVTRLAEMVHGSLPDAISNYTRSVTIAWCVFFGGMALVSLLLFMLAPLEIWSFFANLLNLPLVVAMFLAEYVYRILRFPGFSHASFRDTIRAYRKHGSGPTPGH
jgi:uncharacterized membrane protein